MDLFASDRPLRDDLCDTMGYRGNASIRWRFDREHILNFRALAWTKDARWIPRLRCREAGGHPANYPRGQGGRKGPNTRELSRAGLDRNGRAKTILGIPHASPARGAWGSIKAAVNRGSRRDGGASGHRQIVKWAC